jgi:putative hydrolase of the HAD superfamily
VIKTIFFDVGGVLLTNGWDRSSRSAAVDEFNLDPEEFDDRHDLVSSDFETGRLSLDQYLDRTVFYRERAFDRDSFVAFMKAQSQPLEGSLELLAELSAKGGPLLATLNNESRELNEYRIETFGLRDHFGLFLSSCYLGVKKPDEQIYRTAVDITQHRIEESIFIDDRELNLECSRLLGISSVHFESAAQLRIELAARGVL